MTTGPRARILFVLLHAGYLRHYGPPIRLLAERGHEIHVAVVRGEEKHPGDDLLLSALQAELPNVTSSVAPIRPYEDGWRRLAFFVRAMIDLARYADPAYAHADALRERILSRTVLRLELTRLPQRATRTLAGLVGRLASPTTRERAWRRVERLLVLEDAIPPSPEITAFVRSVGPDLVLASPVVEFASNQVEYLKSARDLGIRTGVCIASWDNLTNKGLIRFRPNRVFVWNEIQRDEAERFDGVPRNLVVATGAPRFDSWFAMTTSVDRETFMTRLGLDPARPYILYLCSSPFIAPDEVSFVRRWLTAVRAAPDENLRQTGVLVRPHPQNAAQWVGVDLAEMGNVAVRPKGGEHPDAGSAKATYYDSMAFSAAVVGINTSALIESGIVGRSVYTVLDPDFARTQEGTLHFHYLRAENGGFVHTAPSFSVHVAQLAAALRETDAHREATLAFIRSFVRPAGLEQTAASVLADALENLACSTEPAAGGLARGALVLRAMLTPLAAITSLAVRLRPRTREGA